MKYFALSSFFAKVIIVLFSILVADSKVTHAEFLRCLFTRISHSSFTSQPIIYTQNDPSYFIVLNSSIQNNRFASHLTPKPVAIVTPLNVSHVQSTVYCSKKHGIQIRIRSNGHDFEGLSYVSSVPFVVIDMRNLSLVSVDVENKSAWVQAGATIGELYYRIAERSGNLGFPAGECPTVGVGGQIGGGGYGYLTRKYGLSADNVLDAKIIDAKGRILHRKSMGEDLFWAIRGGGAASFGIVIAWKLRLVQVPSTITVFDVKRNMEDNSTKNFIHRWQRRASEVENDLSIYIIFQTVSSIDKQGNKKIVLQASIQAMFQGSMERLLQLMQKEFPELGLRRQDCVEMSWVELYLYFNSFRNGEPLEILLNRNFTLKSISSKTKSDHVKKPIPDDVFEGMLEKLHEEEVGMALIYLYPYGGNMNKISESAIPFPHRVGYLYLMQYIVLWNEERNVTSEKHMNWVRRLYTHMTPYVSENPRATYLNFRDLDLGINNYTEDTTRKCGNIAKARLWGLKYFKNNFNRLIRVKTIVDPTNFFTYEQSIPPLCTD